MVAQEDSFHLTWLERASWLHAQLGPEEEAGAVHWNIPEPRLTNMVVKSGSRLMSRGIRFVSCMYSKGTLAGRRKIRLAWLM